MLLAQQFMQGASNRKVSVGVTYLSDFSAEEFQDRLTARQNGKNVELTRKRIDIQAITASFATALIEAAKIAKFVPANDREGNLDLTSRLTILQHMMREVLGDQALSVQSFNVELDDLVPFGADDVRMLQSQIDSYVSQTSDPAWQKAVKKLHINPAKLLDDLIHDAIDSSMNGDKAIRLNFLTAAALGRDPQKLIKMSIPMQRTQNYLMQWLGLDLPMISAVVAHAPKLSNDDVLVRAQTASRIVRTSGFSTPSSGLN
ncbi:MAG: hypothetical protein ACK4VI_03240 [Alphaproteobacteria bacterium]